MNKPRRFLLVIGSIAFVAGCVALLTHIVFFQRTWNSKERAMSAVRAFYDTYLGNTSPRDADSSAVAEEIKIRKDQGNVKGYRILDCTCQNLGASCIVRVSVSSPKQSTETVYLRDQGVMRIVGVDVRQ